LSNIAHVNPQADVQADLRGQPTSTSAVSGRLLKEARRAIDAANTLQQKRESCKRKLQELAARLPTV